MPEERTGNTIRVQQYRSGIGRNRRQRETLKALGLRRLNQIVEREDTPAIRGMVKKIPHLVRLVATSEATDESS